MTIRKILAPVGGGKSDAVVIATALAAAKPLGAHVEVFLSHPDPREAIPYSELPLSPELVQSIVDTAKSHWENVSAATRAALETIAAEKQVKIVPAPRPADRATASFVEKTGYPPFGIEEAARLSDLVVFEPIGGIEDCDTHDALVRVLTRDGRPVLLAPRTASPEVGRRIAIGWDGGTAAAHAVSAALPFLAKADAITILCARQDGGGEKGLADLKSYLALHGVTAEPCVMRHDTGNVAKFLLDAAQQSGCDLLVVGGYGHSRLGESIFGGVTESIVSHPRIAVLIVH